MSEPVSTIEPKKITIDFNDIFDSCQRMDSGIGTYDDLTIIVAGFMFCEEKNKLNPRLGFRKELDSIKKIITDIVEKVNKYGERPEENWFSPFLTQVQQKHLEDLLFLIKNQYMNSPVLDTDRELDDIIEEAINKEDES